MTSLTYEFWDFSSYLILISQTKFFRDGIPSQICCLICYTFEKKKDVRQKSVTPLNDVIYHVTYLRYMTKLKRHNFFCHLTDFDK